MLVLNPQFNFSLSEDKSQMLNHKITIKINCTVTFTACQRFNRKLVSKDTHHSSHVSHDVACRYVKKIDSRTHHDHSIKGVPLGDGPDPEGKGTKVSPGIGIGQAYTPPGRKPTQIKRPEEDGETPKLWMCVKIDSRRGEKFLCFVERRCVITLTTL